MISVEKLLDKNAEDASYDMTVSLRERATRAGWPSDVVSNLSVNFDGEQLKFKYPDHLSEKINDLEYGSLSSRPSSVIRGFMYRSEEHVAAIIDADFVDDLLMDTRAFHG